MVARTEVLSTSNLIIQEVFSYPKLKPIGHEITDFLPEGWILLDSISGYLNNDEFIDWAIVFETKNQVSYINRDGFKQLDKPRIFAILFSDEMDSLVLSVQSNTLLLTSTEGGMMGDPYQGIHINNGLICTGFWGGSRIKWHLSHCFKFDANVWKLVNVSGGGGNSEILESCDYNLETGDFNYDYLEERYFEANDSTALVKKEKYSKNIKLDTLIMLETFTPWTLTIDNKVIF